MKIDNDSQKLDNLKDDILALIHGVDGYKERTAVSFEKRSGYPGAGLVPRRSP